MNEPNRIGLSQEANDFLDEMLDSLNSEVNGSSLIKFDFYRLAVALGIKNQVKANTIQSIDSFRVDELDEGRALYYSVKASDLYKEGESIYRAIEKLADHGIREFHKNYQKNSGEIDWKEILA